MATDILIVDDEADIRELVAGILSDEGHGTRTAKNSDETLAAIEARRPHLVFLDIWLQGSRLDGLQILALIKEHHPSLPVVMISGHGNVETAVSAIKIGAYDFIEKPFKADRLVLVADRALETSRLKREVTELRGRTGATNRIVGKSTAMNQLRQVIDRVAPANSRILITGAPGSGKELTARSVHDTSARSAGPFVVINAATMTPDMMEVELFGTEGGEGRQRQVGALEEAHGGTLYIDEIADMPKRDAGQDACGSWSNRISIASVAPRGSTSTSASSPRRARATSPTLIAEGSLPRGSVPPPVRRADPRAVAVRTSRGHPDAHRLLPGSDERVRRLAAAQGRRGCHGGAAIA